MAAKVLKIVEPVVFKLLMKEFILIDYVVFYPLFVPTYLNSMEKG
jgi:hypothetical protein